MCQGYRYDQNSSGIVYDNGMQLSQLYDGKNLPCYHHENDCISVGLTSRLEPRDTKNITWVYCKDSPSIDEKPLQDAILAAINQVMSRKEDLVAQIEDSMRMELSPIPNESMSISDIDQRISDLEEEFKKLFAASREEGGY